jgi:acyl-coenzyme A synthetase/AMP-(fatty) acid ligase
MADRVQPPLWRYYLVELLDHWQYVAFGLLVGAALTWWWTRPDPTNDAVTAVACRQMYTLATSPADTARVDALYPHGPGAHDAMTCGRMRGLGLLE